MINDVKTEVKVETIIDEEEDWGDNSPPTPHPSEDWDAEADDMPFYIPVRRTITVEQWGMRCPAVSNFYIKEYLETILSKN